MFAVVLTAQILSQWRVVLEDFSQFGQNLRRHWERVDLLTISHDVRATAAPQGRQWEPFPLVRES